MARRFVHQMQNVQPDIRVVSKGVVKRFVKMGQKPVAEKLIVLKGRFVRVGVVSSPVDIVRKMPIVVVDTYVKVIVVQSRSVNFVHRMETVLQVKFV